MTPRAKVCSRLAVNARATSSWERFLRSIVYCCVLLLLLLRLCGFVSVCCVCLTGVSSFRVWRRFERVPGFQSRGKTCRAFFVFCLAHKSNPKPHSANSHRDTRLKQRPNARSRRIKWSSWSSRVRDLGVSRSISYTNTHCRKEIARVFVVVQVCLSGITPPPTGHNDEPVWIIAGDLCGVMHVSNGWVCSLRVNVTSF